uniref:Ion transport domain-containing protein n=1 Tax=Petromyzon marinus TaxID=7757 RepID=S4RQ14_PETMA
QSSLTPLHLAAQAGHESLVRLLLNHPSTQEDLQAGPQATTPLHLACQGGHAAVAGLLLSRAAPPLLRTLDQRGHSCLHLAATAGHVETLRLLLGQGADINATDKSGCTPLHVAARAGRLPAVRALLESGAVGSAECRDGRTALEHAAGGGHRHVLALLLRHSTLTAQRLIHFVYDLMVCGRQCEFRVIDEFVLLAPAPLEAAVKLTRAFGAAALREKERSVDLDLAARHCQALATDLLSLAVGSQSAGAAALLQAVDERGLSLLDVLIECHQRAVAAHPAVQHHLSDVWRGGLRWPSWCPALLLLGFLVCPPLWVAFSLPLGHRFTRIPIIKFLCHLASHLFLLSLFVLTVVWPPITPIAEGHLLPSWNEWLLLTWLLGLLLAELRQGGSRFGLAWIRLLVLGLSGLALLCHLSALAFPAGSHALLECLCARNVLLAKALAFCCVQLLDFLSFHHLFGPWAIIISDLMKDLARFGMVLGIFHVAFTLHLTALCQPVYPQGDPVGNSSTAAAAWDPSTAAQTTLDVTVLLFFSLFGMGDQNSLPDVSRSPSIVSTLVNATFGVYLIVTLIVLINLLIAMMSDTYQRIQAQSDTQWKFGRVVLVREATRRTTPPAPLNVVTQLLWLLQRCACRKACKKIQQPCSVTLFKVGQTITQGSSLDSAWISRERYNGVSFSIHLVVLAESQRVGERLQPCRIEDVLDWRAVAQRYRAMKGTLE